MPDEKPTTSDRWTGVCVESWRCPLCGPRFLGQTAEGHESTTNLAAHRSVVHKDVPLPGPYVTLEDPS